MKIHLAHRFNKAVDNLLNKVRDHRWHMNVQKSDTESNNYYVCKKTGDRKAEKNTLRDDNHAVDVEWLKNGSGRYYIDGQEFGEATHAEEAIKKVKAALAAEKKHRIDSQYLLFHSDDNNKKRSRRPRPLTP